MRQIARLPQKDREALFQSTAAAIGINEAIVEKDFWVCWMLDYLFHECPWKDALTFKGGTSLSKAFALIQRFSEDIDLILDWQVLGYAVDEPWRERSNTKQDLFNKTVNEKTADFLDQIFLPVVNQFLSQNLQQGAHCYIEPHDLHTVRFLYPRSFTNEAILQEIRLEIGSLAAWSPAKKQSIMPYSAEQYGRLFSQHETVVRTILPQRTFWEKATILHREAFRVNEIPHRYSRHYYDLFCMSKTNVKEKAFRNIELLQQVAVFKSRFYRCGWAHYELAVPGSLRLIPQNKHIAQLEKDYARMQNMIFGQTPDFLEILKYLKLLEDEING